LLILFELYQQGNICLSKSAELAGMKVDKFLDESRKRRLIRSGGPASSKEAEEEFQAAKNLLK